MRTPTAHSHKPSLKELIHQRLTDKTSKAGHRNDPWKLAFVYEDGGMRWVIPGGMGACLEQHDIEPDIVVGTSGGGLAGAYGAACMTTAGCMVVQHLTCLGYHRNGPPLFIDKQRLWRGNQPVMDVEGLVEIAFSKLVPLAWDTLREGRIPVYVTAVSRDGTLHMLPLHGVSLIDQKLALKNTARVPHFAHDVKDPEVLWDGSLMAGIPVQQALELGATHVLVLRCRAAYTGIPKTPLDERLILRRILRRQAPDLYRLLIQRGRFYQDAMEAVANLGPAGMIIALPKVSIGGGTIDEKLLLQHMADAYHEAGRALELPALAIPQIWAAAMREARV